MANKLNELVCASIFGNTGVADCFLDPKRIEGYILVPSTWKKTKAEIAAGFKTELQDDVIAAAVARIFPVHNLVAMADGSEELVIETLGYGAKKPVREGYLDWKFEVGKGGLLLAQNLRKFNGSAPAVLFYDSDGVLYGYDKDGDLAGIPTLFFWQHPIKVNNGQNVSKYMSQFSFHPKYLNDFVAYVKCDFDLGSVNGLLDVDLAAFSQVSNVINVTAITAIGGQDLGVLYATELASAALWTAKRLDTGVAITITTVTALNGRFVVTLDNTAFGALAAGTKVEINLAAPSVLDAASVKGYEGVPLVITK